MVSAQEFCAVGDCSTQAESGDSQWREPTSGLGARTAEGACLVKMMPQLGVVDEAGDEMGIEA